VLVRGVEWPFLPTRGRSYLLSVLARRRGEPSQAHLPEVKRLGAAEHRHTGVGTPIDHEQSPILLLCFIPRYGSIVGAVAWEIAVDLWENDYFRGQRDGICAGGLVEVAPPLKVTISVPVLIHTILQLE
jgi:hypothetical protein